MNRVRIAAAGLALSIGAVGVVATPEPAEAAIPADIPCTYFSPHGILDRLQVAFLDHETADVAVYFCVVRHANTTIRHRFWVVEWKRTGQWTWHPL